MKKHVLILLAQGCLLLGAQAWAESYYGLCVGKANAIEGACIMGNARYPHLAELEMDEEGVLTALKRSPDASNELRAAGKAYDPRSGWFFKRQ
jgi:hypothetical protein